MLNLFRLAADFSHLFSFVILLYSIHKKKSASGISLVTQELYALVFICRYLDLFEFYSVYNTIFKIVYLLFSIGIVLLMRFVKPYSTTYEADTKEQDNFSRFLLIVPCFILALVFNYERQLSFSWPVVQEILWTFSIYLEAVAIFPQLMVLQRTGKVENMTSNYVFTLGCYRGASAALGNARLPSFPFLSFLPVLADDDLSFCRPLHPELGVPLPDRILLPPVDRVDLRRRANGPLRRLLRSLLPRQARRWFERRCDCVRQRRLILKSMALIWNPARSFSGNLARHAHLAFCFANTASRIADLWHIASMGLVVQSVPQTRCITITRIRSWF